MQYIAIDFETAAQTKDSACAIGLVRFNQDGEVLDRYYSLIRPKSLVFDPVCTAVHHLDPIDIANAPTLPEIWNDIRSFIGTGMPLVAHNAPFDMYVLKASAESWGLGGIEVDYYDTLTLSRKIWPGLPSYRLTSLASDLGWTYDAHMALDDALICGRLFQRLCRENLYDEHEFWRFMKKLYRDNHTGYPKHLSIVQDTMDLF